jgi:hypothetical protein
MKHVIHWFVVLDGKRLPRQATMRGTWGYDATCSCGWDSKVGGGTLRHIRDKVSEHKWEVANGFIDN